MLQDKDPLIHTLDSEFDAESALHQDHWELSSRWVLCTGCSEADTAKEYRLVQPAIAITVSILNTRKWAKKQLATEVP